MQRLTLKTIIIDNKSDDKPELTIADLLLRNVRMKSVKC